ncbi:MAG: hypothetical protein WC707_00030 [Candidatus Babeliaceae bacterium]|jgi:hypothetical protein
MNKRQKQLLAIIATCVAVNVFQPTIIKAGFISNWRDSLVQAGASKLTNATVEKVAETAITPVAQTVTAKVTEATVDAAAKAAENTLKYGLDPVKRVLDGTLNYAIFPDTGVTAHALQKAAARLGGQPDAPIMTINTERINSIMQHALTNTRNFAYEYPWLAGIIALYGTYRLYCFAASYNVDYDNRIKTNAALLTVFNTIENSTEIGTAAPNATIRAAIKLACAEINKCYNTPNYSVLQWVGNKYMSRLMGTSLFNFKNEKVELAKELQAANTLNELKAVILKYAEIFISDK